MNPNDYKHDLNPLTEQDLQDEADDKGYFWIGNPSYERSASVGESMEENES